MSISNTSVVTFYNNSIRYDDGGAIYAYCSCHISFSGASVITFNNNFAGNHGGDIYASSGHISFSDTSVITFNNNFAGNHGGAIYASSCHISFSDTSVVTFNNNIAGDYGGAIYASSSCHISFSGASVITFSNNSTRDGGAVYMYYYTDISFNDTSSVTFVGRSGGAIYAARIGSYITFNGTSVITFLCNTAIQYGGAVYIKDHFKIFFDEHTSVTFYNSYATRGSALYSINDCSLWFEGNSMVMFTENSVTSYGSAVYTLVTLIHIFRVTHLCNLSVTIQRQVT